MNHPPRSAAITASLLFTPKKMHVPHTLRAHDHPTVDKRRGPERRQCRFQVPRNSSRLADQGALGARDVRGQGGGVGGLELRVFYDGAAVGEE
ncbi:hypothetical protein GCM10009630_09630 [Kribbella jejuensis]